MRFIPEDWPDRLDRWATRVLTDAVGWLFDWLIGRGRR